MPVDSLRSPSPLENRSSAEAHRRPAGAGCSRRFSWPKGCGAAPRGMPRRGLGGGALAAAAGPGGPPLPFGSGRRQPGRSPRAPLRPPPTRAAMLYGLLHLSGRVSAGINRCQPPANALCNFRLYNPEMRRGKIPQSNLNPAIFPRASPGNAGQPVASGGRRGRQAGTGRLLPPPAQGPQSPLGSALRQFSEEAPTAPARRCGRAGGRERVPERRCITCSPKSMAMLVMPRGTRNRIRGQ